MNILQRILDLFTSTPEEVSELEQLIAHVDNPAHRAIYEAVIKQQIKYRDSDNVAKGQKCPKCDEYIPSKNDTSKLLPKLAVKVLDQIIILEDMIGIQPMQGPVGLVYKLRIRETGQEGGEGKGTRLSLEIMSQAIEAQSRKFHARWSIESAQDLKAQHGTNMEEEILQAVANEMACEIIDGILDAMRSKATPVKLDSFFAGSALSVHINKAANTIAQLTRRGAGNFIIVDPITLSILQGDKNAPFVKIDDETTEKQKNLFRLKQVGTLNNTIRVYCDLLGNDTIIGYKGSNDTDAGIIYSPYTMIMSTGPVMDPATFQPQMSFMTRYGKDMDDNAKGYYHTLDVQVPSVEDSLNDEQELLLEEAS